MDIREFVTARLDEDESAARAVEGHQLFDGTGILMMHLHGGTSRSVTLPSHVTTYAVRFDPARMLAEVAAKRGILRRYQNAAQGLATVMKEPQTARSRQDATEDLLSTNVAALRMAVKLLAALYAEHPDYDPAWEIEP